MLAHSGIGMKSLHPPENPTQLRRHLDSACAITKNQTASRTPTRQSSRVGCRDRSIDFPNRTRIRLNKGFNRNK